MDYKLHRVRLSRGGSYIKSYEWLVNEKATINQKNQNDNECLQWSTISALNYNEIVKSLKTYSKKIRHECKYFSSQKRDCEQNNESIALNVLFSSQNSEEINFYISQNINIMEKVTHFCSWLMMMMMMKNTIILL